MVFGTVQGANLVGTLPTQCANLVGTLSTQCANLVGTLSIPTVIYTSSDPKTYILVDDYGNEVTAVVSDKPVILDATANDIRIGTTAATSEGVTVGEKEIPSYHTCEGVRGVLSGSEAIIKLEDENAYDFTKMQAIICLYNGTVADSVAAEKVAIENKVYAANSTEVLSIISLDHDNKEIKLGIINTSGDPMIIRYFTYKEEL